MVRVFEALTELSRDGLPVFAIVDEVETLATDRNEISGKTSPIDARASVNALLEQLDRKPANCILLATKNVVELLDTAVRDRFDFNFRIDSPDAGARLRALSTVISAINPESSSLKGVPKVVLHGSTMSGLLDTIAVLTSMALQYGVPVDALARKFEYTRFDPAGWTKNPDLRRVNSIVDYLFRWLGSQCSPAYRAEQVNKTFSDASIEDLS